MLTFVDSSVFEDELLNKLQIIFASLGLEDGHVLVSLEVERHILRRVGHSHAVAHLRVLELVRLASDHFLVLFEPGFAQFFLQCGSNVNKLIEN